jgi:bifunctional DNase/RNase
MPVQMQLSRIIISEITDQQYIFLKEIDGARTLPIIIGEFEARSIDTGVKRIRSPRPRTHELIIAAIETLGGELDSVVISELKDHIYFARLRVRREGELIEIDSRPSDAIAVAVACDPHLPIYVEEDVLTESSAN